MRGLAKTIWTVKPNAEKKDIRGRYTKLHAISNKAYIAGRTYKQGT